MSTVEERTREALHDAVDSLGVTDDDISRMEAELGAALPRTRRPVAPRGTTPARRRWSLAADGEMLAVMYAPAYLEGFAGDRPRLSLGRRLHRVPGAGLHGDLARPPGAFRHPRDLHLGE